MSLDPAECPTFKELESIARGESPSKSVAMHLSRCRRCAQYVSNARFGQRFESVMSGASEEKIAIRESFPEIFGYEIHSEIARGGQGIVYRATQGTTGKVVAIKVLHPEVAGTSRQARERMAREIQIASSLSHPGIVGILDSVKMLDGRDALVMELIEGEGLGDWCRLHSEHTEQQLLDLLAQIAEAVHYAHQRGVIHRDLKPSNVLIDSSGVPRILDFGVARRSDPGLIDSDITRTREFTGTLAYAAPEQVSQEAQTPDIRTDVYALGAIGFELLTGKPLLTTDGSLLDIVDRITSEDPPSRTEAGISRDAWVVLTKAVSKRKERRYQSAAELARDLHSAALGDAVVARADSSWYTLRKSARKHKATLTITALILAGLAGVLLSLVVGNTRLSSALRESRLLQIRAQISLGNREQSERLLWQDIDSDLGSNLDATDALWLGSPREMELLWAFVEMQSVATNLNHVRKIAIPEYGIWNLSNGKLLWVSRDRRVITADPETWGGDSYTGITVPSSVDAVKATPSGNNLVCFENGLMRVIDSKEGPLSAQQQLGYSNLSDLRVAAAEWGIAVADEKSGLTLYGLPTLGELAYFDDALPAQTPWLDQDRRRICYMTTDGTLRLRDITADTVLVSRELAEPTFSQIGPSPQLLVSPDYTRCAIAYGGGLVVIDMENQVHPEPLLSHPGYRVWVSSDPDWNVMTAFAHGDPTLHLWDTNTWQPYDGLPGHSGSVVSHSFTSDSKKLVTLDAAGDLRVWSSPVHSWRRGLGGATGKTHQLDYSARTSTLFTFDDSEKLQAHNRTGESGPIESEIRAVRIAVSDDHGLLATCDLSNTLEILPLEDAGRGQVVRLDSDSIAGMQFRPGEHPPVLAVAQNPGALVLVDPINSTKTETRAVPSAAVISDLTWSGDGNWVALGMRDGTIAVLDLLKEGGEFKIIRTASAQLRSLTFLPGSIELLAVGDPGMLHKINVQTGHIHSSGTLSEHSLFCVEVHPAGEIAMVGDRAGLVKAIRLSDMRELALFDAVGSVMSMRFIDDGDALAVSALDRPPEYWNFRGIIETFDTLRDARR